MHIWTILTVTVIAAACLYLLLPVLACRINRQLSQAALSRHQHLPLHRKKSRFAKVLSVLVDKSRCQLNQAGFTRTVALKIYLLIQCGIPGLILIFGLLSGTQNLQTLAGSVLLAVLVNRMLRRRASERKKAFVRSLYKIYRFLDGQISSGVAATDALRGLSTAVRDPVVYPALVQFTAIYEVTLDSDRAFDVLRRLFHSQDCDLLSVHVHQCLQSGVAGKSMVRMEELLFARTFGLMQEETRRIRTFLTLTVAGGLVPLMILFLYPMLHSAAGALQSIFG
ncbi:MAG: hypothetical protein SCM11_00185 [Bacillota bacterium]|nr:hypothetical protein [Bacillota bacterium]